VDNLVNQIEGLEETTPGPTPLKVENRENVLFEAWKTSTPQERSALEYQILQSVRRHASKVCWMVLHSHQPDLIDEIAQDVLMDLGSFREQSAFSTWVHSRARFRCQSQFKQNRQRREVSITALPSTQLYASERDSNMFLKVLVQELLANLSVFERQLVDLKVDEGLSDAEIGLRLGFTREWIQKSWSRLRKKLKGKYNA
jgi:RNA polymerase sigma factor (sigma-70 family)